MFLRNSGFKNLVAFLCVYLMFLSILQVPIKAQNDGETVITIDLDNQIANELSRDLFGVNARFTNHGEGIWDPETNDINPEILELYRQQGISNFRYPGGTVGNTFRWKDSIGTDRKKSPWVYGRGEKPPVPTDWGLDEATRFAQSNNNGNITFMYGMAVGTPKDAAELIMYLNMPYDENNPDAYGGWPKKRAENGHPEPYNVKNFEIGNEMFFDGQKFFLHGDYSEGNNRSLGYKYFHGGVFTFEKEPAVAYDNFNSYTSISDGSKEQEFYIQNAPAGKLVLEDSNSGTSETDSYENVNFTLYVKNNGSEEKWERVDDFSNSGENSKHYILDLEKSRVIFGDGNNGKIPKKDSQILFSYSAYRSGFKHYVEAMKSVDDSIKIYSCILGDSFINIANNSNLDYDGLAEHLYQGWFGTNIPSGSTSNVNEYHQILMAKQNDLIAHLLKKRDRLNAPNSNGEQTDRDILISEWGIFSVHRPYFGHKKGLGGAIFNADTLIDLVNNNFNTANFHVYIHKSTNSVVEPDSHVYAAAGKPFEMMNHNQGNIPLEPNIKNNPVRVVDSNTKYEKLNLMITKDSDYIYVNVVNKDNVDDVTAKINFQNDIQIDNMATTWTLNGDFVGAVNRVDDRNNVTIKEDQIDYASSSFEYTFPKHSVTKIRLAIDNDGDKNKESQTSNILRDTQSTRLFNSDLEDVNIQNQAGAESVDKAEYKNEDNLSGDLTTLGEAGFENELNEEAGLVDNDESEDTDSGQTQEQDGLFERIKLILQNLRDTLAQLVDF